MWITSALAIFSTVMQMMQQGQQAQAQKQAADQQRQAAAEAKNIADQNAAREEAATAETARKQTLQNQSDEAAARAAAAASGLAYNPEDKTGSIALSLVKQKTENKAQMDYAAAAGKSRADIIRAGGQLAYNQGLAQATSMSNAAKASWWGMLGSGAKLGGQIYGLVGSSATNTSGSVYWKSVV